MKFVLSLTTLAAIAASTSLVPVQVQALSSQPECQAWTQQHQYETNVNLAPAEEGYYASVAESFDETCRDDEGSEQECRVALDGSTNEATLYEEECNKAGGYIWTYSYSPICGNGTTAISWLDEIMICASAACIDIGVSNLIPAMDLQEAMGTADCVSVVEGPQPKTTTLVTDGTDEGSGVSQPECRDWTIGHLFDHNEDLLPAEDAYMKQVAGTIETNCFETSDANSTQQIDCDITIGEGDLRTAYMEECFNEGGTMWKYDFNGACGNTESWMRNIYFCASPSCESEGAANLMPHQQLYVPYTSKDLDCGSTTNNQAQVMTAAEHAEDAEDKESGSSDSGSGSGAASMAGWSAFFILWAITALVGM